MGAGSGAIGLLSSLALEVSPLHAAATSYDTQRAAIINREVFVGFSPCSWGFGGGLEGLAMPWTPEERLRRREKIGEYGFSQHNAPVP